MIVDCYTHIWESPGQLGRLAGSGGGITSPTDGRAAAPPNASAARHLAAGQQVDATLVLGFKSVYLGAEIPNDVVAGYVRSHPQRLIGFAGIDPMDGRGALGEMERAKSALGMKGVALSPAAQGMHPCHSRAEAIYERAAEWKWPVYFHPGVQVTAETKLEYAQPILLDQVAREHPGLKLIIAHLGHPWVQETLALLAKHENVFSDVSWLLNQPWQAYQALLSAHQYGVMDKLLFGSGFPYNCATPSIEALYGINHLCAGTNLPKIPREALRSVVECNALELLGIPYTAAPAPAGVRAVLDDEGDAS